MNGGVNYRVAPPGIEIINGKLYVNSNYPGAVFTYTVDGSEPTRSSAKFTEPISISGKEVKVIAFYPNGKQSRAAVIKL